MLWLFIVPIGCNWIFQLTTAGRFARSSDSLGSSRIGREPTVDLGNARRLPLLRHQVVDISLKSGDRLIVLIEVWLLFRGTLSVCYMFVFVISVSRSKQDNDKDEHCQRTSRDASDQKTTTSFSGSARRALCRRGVSLNSGRNRSNGWFLLSSRCSMSLGISRTKGISGSAPSPSQSGGLPVMGITFTN